MSQLSPHISICTCLQCPEAEGCVGHELHLSSHVITPFSPPLAPSSIHLLLFDLSSPQPPLSSGLDCGEVSLSLMAVGLLPARPPLCPQLEQHSTQAEGQESREVSQTEPLHRNNKPQQNIFFRMSLWRQAFKVQVQVCH